MRDLLNIRKINNFKKDLLKNFNVLLSQKSLDNLSYRLNIDNGFECVVEVDGTYYKSLISIENDFKNGTLYDISLKFETILKDILDNDNIDFFEGFKDLQKKLKLISYKEWKNDIIKLSNSVPYILDMKIKNDIIQVKKLDGKLITLQNIETCKLIVLIEKLYYDSIQILGYPIMNNSFTDNLIEINGEYIIIDHKQLIHGVVKDLRYYKYQLFEEEGLKLMPGTIINSDIDKILIHKLEYPYLNFEIMYL